MIEILSLGGGVQSTTVALMSVVGELPPLRCAIFADTGWEPRAVYTHMEWLEATCKPHFPVIRVSDGNIRADALVSQVRGKTTDGHRWASMPYFVRSPDGGRGMIRRQCTQEYKIDPIERYIKREILGLAHRARAPVTPVVRSWFGISRDEARRCRVSPSRWKENWYPLVDELQMTRAGCLAWLERNGFPEPPRSACIGCPFHHDSEWRKLKVESPAEFEDACEFDDAIRHCGGMRGEIYLHSYRFRQRPVAAV